MIPYGRQDINQDDIDSVVNILKSDFLTQGPQVPIFENLVSKKVGAKYGLCANSATSALHMACSALDLNKGDYLWTSPITFVASSNCGLYCGAQIDFVDIDLISYNICPIALEKKLIDAKNQNKLPKVLVAVHLAGFSCDMKKIYDLSIKYSFKIIEDASHAIGGKYMGEYIGSCRYSDITIFSFHPVKIITTAEGGMAMTNSSTLAKKMELFRTHGITRDQSQMTHKPDGPWFYQQVSLGFNYRMTELQAALGISQLDRLDEFVSIRHQLASRYDELLLEFPLQVPTRNIDTYSALHLYIITLDLKKCTESHLDIFNKLREQGIGVNLHYIPVHTHPYYQELGFHWGDFPKSELYYKSAISLPMFPGLSHSDQNQVVSSLKSSLNI